MTAFSEIKTNISVTFLSVHLSVHMRQIAIQNMEAQTKFLPFYTKNTNFVWKLLYIGWIFIEILRFNSSIDLDTGFVPNRSQAIIWTSGILAYWHMYALPGLNGLIHLWFYNENYSSFSVIFYFLAATKQLYEWYFLSVCLSVCPSHLFDYVHHHYIIMKFSGVITKDQGNVHTKGQGQRSRSQRSQPNLAVSWL